MLLNTHRSKRENRSLSWPSRALSDRHKMSDPVMISASGPSFDGPEMFYRDCSKWIIREKSPFCCGTQLGARENVDISLVPAGPCLLDTIGVIQA